MMQKSLCRRSGFPVRRQLARLTYTRAFRIAAPLREWKAVGVTEVGPAPAEPGLPGWTGVGAMNGDSFHGDEAGRAGSRYNQARRLVQGVSRPRLGRRDESDMTDRCGTGPTW